MTQPSLTITLGRIHWKGFRELVEYQRFLGHKVEMFEGRGFLDRTFAVKGDFEAIKSIYERLKAFEEHHRKMETSS